MVMGPSVMGAIDELRAAHGVMNGSRAPTRGGMFRILAVRAYRDLEARRGVPSRTIEAATNEQTPTEATASPPRGIVEPEAALRDVEHHGAYEDASTIDYDRAIIDSGILS